MSVVGAVVRPTTIAHVHEAGLEYYVNRSGGYTEDADIAKEMVLRVDGSMFPADQVEKIEEGDLIYVPPNVMSLEIVEKGDRIKEAVKFGIVTTITVAAIIGLISLF